jgi:hypothetical protein
MTLEALHPVRKMRGGAQAFLLEANDGRFYVVKFQNNPQHRRILINESLCSTFLNHLGLPAPLGCPILLTPEFCQSFPQVVIEWKEVKHPPVPVPGWHFGSLFPGDPDSLAVFDYLPDSMLQRLPQPDIFLGALVFDRWIGNTDSRQTIFFRGADNQLNTWLIDHGYAFNGPSWQFLDGPLQSIYHRPIVYRSVQNLSSFQTWSDRVRNLPEQALDLALRAIPSQWLEQDEPELEQLLIQLYRRRKRIDHLVEDTWLELSKRI